MNRLNNILITIMLSGALFLGGVSNIDTDRRMIPAVETVRILLADMAAQKIAERNNVFKAVVIVYNGSGHGTGFFINKTQLLTNHHMVAKKNGFGKMSREFNEHVTIQLQDGTQMLAKVLKSNPDQDIALIELVEGEHKDFLTISKTESKDGTFVYIAGNGGYDFFWAKGGFLRNHFKFNGLWKNTQRLAYMKSKGGFSGSPVIDASTGQVVGVHAGGAPSMALAIHVPVTDINAFLESEAKVEKVKFIEERVKAAKTAWPDLVQTPNQTHHFSAWNSHLTNVNVGEVMAFAKHFNLSVNKGYNKVTFHGEAQASQRLLMHIYFGEDLKVAPEERVISTRLYISAKAVSGEQIEALEAYNTDNGVIVEYHQPTDKYIFTGPKVKLIAIANFILRGQPLS